MPDQTSDRRRRCTFWIDDKILDDYAPMLGRFSIGPAAIAVYAALARRADRDGDSWPRLRSIADQAATSPNTARRAIRLLEALGLVEVAARYEQGSHRQTSNLYTLLTPPAQPPHLGDDPDGWPTPERRIVLIEPPRPGVSAVRPESVADARRAYPPPLRPTPSLSDRGSPPPQVGGPLPDREAMKETPSKDRTRKEARSTQTKHRRRRGFDGRSASTDDASPAPSKPPRPIPGGHRTSRPSAGRT